MMEKITEFLNQSVWGNEIWQYLLFLAIILFSILLGKLFNYFSKTKLRKIAARTKTNLDVILIDIIEEPIVLLIVAIGIWIGSGFLELGETFSKIVGNIIQVLLQSLHIGTYSLVKSSLEKTDVVIEPDVVHIGAAEFHHAQECIRLGELAAQEAMPEIRSRLGA